MITKKKSASALLVGATNYSLVPDRVLLFCIFVFLLLSFWFTAPQPSFAGGPYVIADTGVPALWDNSDDIVIHPETGSCAGMDTATMTALIEEVLANWTGLEEVDLAFAINEGGIDEDIDGDNYEEYLVLTEDDAVEDDFSPIIFDNDASIIAAIAGTENQYAVLGLASAAVFSDDGTEILEGQAVINCRCLEGHEDGECEDDAAGTVVFPLSTVEFTILHEMGHFLNLDHTQVNIDLYSDVTNTEYDNLPVMFPYIVDPDTQMSPHWDDTTALASLYPSNSFEGDVCHVTGDLIDEDGNPVRCADVWAVDGDDANTTASVSGALAVASDDNSDGDTVDFGECEENCGHFELWLRPGSEYTISTKPIYSEFTDGSGMGPCYLDQLETIEDEDIAVVTAAQCTAGNAIDLGNITVNSSSSSGQASPVDDGDPISVGGEAGSATDPGGWWCSLRFTM